MSFSKPIRFKPLGKHIVLSYGGKTLAKISKAGLKSFLADFGQDEGVRLQKEERAKKSKTKKVMSDLVGEAETKARQFARAYETAMRTFYRRKTVKLITPMDKDFKFFIAALPVLERNSVTYKKFIQAQVHGLKFLNNGKGKFPSPNQLATPGAEQRLLEYLELDTTDEGKVIQFDIPEKERSMPLSSNPKFTTRRTKVRERFATLKETLYVKTLEELRRPKGVEQFVLDYLDELEKGGN